VRLELDEDAAAETLAARFRNDVHALQLCASLVEAADAAARDRAPVAVAHDEKDTVGLHEHRRLACRADVGDAAVAAAHLLLLRVAQRGHVGRVERLRPRTHRTQRRAARR
jgi:hypothetical protein